MAGFRFTFWTGAGDRWRRATMAVALVFVLGLAGCVTSTQAPREPVFATAEARTAYQLRIYDRVAQLTGKHFYAADYHGVDWPAAVAKHRPAAAAATDPTALYDVINELLGELADGHTQALTPREAFVERTQRDARVGLQLERVEGAWLVDEVLPGSPAAEAGIEPGWIVLARNGLPLGERLDLRPQEGERVAWIFRDTADRRHDLELTARVLDVSGYVSTLPLAGGWVYLRFDEFELATHAWLRHELRRFRDARGFIVDLRRNSGGDTLALARALGDFLPQRIPYGTFVARDGDRDPEGSARWRAARVSAPLAVLTGPVSASSAEIFAAVLQREKRAVVIGRPTAGVVIGSRMFRLPDGGELQLGLYDFLLTDGTRLEGRGVQPDIAVTPTLADRRSGRDLEVETALTWLERESGRIQVRPTPAATTRTAGSRK